ncbi:MAG: RluA family pseudouridine synthase [Gammaproteobacteria bacterium]
MRSTPIAAPDAGRRLDNYLLATLKGAPRSLIYKLVRSGQVRVNGGRVKPAHRLEAGDEVRIPPLETGLEDGTVAIPGGRIRELEAAILYEDDRLIVLDKPAGLACHGGSGLPYGVIEIMRAARPHDLRLDLAHRLDRDTSGCLILCKELVTLRMVNAAIRERAAIKNYTALLYGQLPSALRRIDAALGITRDRDGERRSAVDDAGKTASTLIEEAASCGPHTLVSLRLVTGRMHQIRAHARHIGHPVAGDRHYGDKDFNRVLAGLGLKRLFLHAARVAITTPDWHIDVSAPLPPALSAVAERLRQGEYHRSPISGQE